MTKFFSNPIVFVAATTLFALATLMTAIMRTS
jgi:hypothetical protein